VTDHIPLFVSTRAHTGQSCKNHLS